MVISNSLIVSLQFVMLRCKDHYERLHLHAWSYKEEDEDKEEEQEGAEE